MRQFIITICLSCSLFIYALSINFFESFVMFILFGVIPGTETSLSPYEMSLIIGATAVIFAMVSMRSYMNTASVFAYKFTIAQLTKITLPKLPKISLPKARSTQS